MGHFCREGERLNGREKVTTFLGAVWRKRLELVLLLLSEISVHWQWPVSLTAMVLKCYKSVFAGKECGGWERCSS